MSTATTVLQHDVVEVLVEGEQLIRYRQVVKMPRAEFEKLDEMLEKGGRIALDAEMQVGDRINVHDVFDAGDFQLEDFRLMEDEGGDDT